jgi:hypothetical protein
MKNRFITYVVGFCLMLVAAFLNQSCSSEKPGNVTLHYAVKCDVLQQFKDRNRVFYSKKAISNYTQVDSMEWNVWNSEKISDTLLFKDEHHNYHEFGERSFFAKTCLVIDSIIPQKVPANQTDTFNYSVYVRGFSQILIVENKTHRSLLKMDATYRFDIKGDATSNTDVVKIKTLFVLFLKKHVTSTVSKDLAYYMSHHPVSNRWEITEPEFKRFNACEN